MKVELDINASALSVGKDDVLILVMPTYDFPEPDEGEEDLLDMIMRQFTELGIADRVFVIVSDDAKMVKVERSPQMRTGRSS